MLRMPANEPAVHNPELGKWLPVRPLQGEHSFPVSLAQALHALHLIDDQVPPPHPRERCVAPEELLVGRDADVEAVGLHPSLGNTKQGLARLSAPPSRAVTRAHCLRSPVPTHSHLARSS